MCRQHGRNPTYVTPLKVQHRMHPDIARLVNSLFYSDHTWETSRVEQEGGVRWIDTSCYGSHQYKSEGKSLYNLNETKVIHSLIQNSLSLNQGEILVISPYLAQVNRINVPFGGKTTVRTIDGCQGIERNIVIVSFVCFTSAFVVDARRLNVALSRARDFLYLVGNLKEMQKSVEKQYHKYPHMVGLVRLFCGSGGQLRHCVKMATDFVRR
jgi:superfamily I DNA and/or RNA helicase